jgi:hypothetical protein
MMRVTGMEVNKYIRAVASLIQRTQENRLAWRPALTPGGPRITNEFFATHEGKDLHLYTFDPPIFSGLPRGRVVLEIVGEDRMPIWTFPDAPTNADLLEAVKYQAARVDDFLEALIRE